MVLSLKLLRVNVVDVYKAIKEISSSIKAKPRPFLLSVILLE